MSRKSFKTYLIVRTLFTLIITIYLLNTLFTLKSVKVESYEETGIVLEVFPIPGNKCKKGELYVKVQLPDKLVILTDEIDWFKLYDKVGEEVTINCKDYTFKDGYTESVYYSD